MQIHPSIALLLAVTLQTAYRRAANEGGLLGAPLFPVAIVQKDVPLSRALSYIGTELNNGYVLFGVEVRLKDGREPTIDLDLPPGVTLRSALRQVFGQLPQYKFEVVSQHVIDVYPAGAMGDSVDALNVPVRAFDVTDKQADLIISKPYEVIPELRRRLAPSLPGGLHPRGYLGPGLSSIGLGVTLHLRNVTLRQILNAVSEATENFPGNLSPFGWLYSFEPDQKSPVGLKYSWSVLPSAPHNWKREESGSGVILGAFTRRRMVAALPAIKFPTTPISAARPASRAEPAACRLHRP